MALNINMGGRPAQIDREQILEAALSIGVDNLSMHAVARKLGVSTTALYRYVDSKDALINCCMDLFCERVLLPSKDLPWHEFLEGVGHAFRRALAQTPGAYAYGFKVGPTTPAAYRIIEDSLTALVDAGLTSREAWWAYGLVVDHAFVFAQKESHYREMERQHGPGGYRVVRLSDEEVAPFPVLGEVIANAQPPEFEEAFAYQLRCIVDGVAASVARQR